MSSKKSAKKTARAKKVRTEDAVVDPTSDAALQALATSYAAAPDIPVAIQAAELASLGRLAKGRGAAFAKIGITAAQITNVSAFGKRLGELERTWQRSRAGVRLTTAEKKLRDEAEALDKHLLAGGRWALRKDAAAQTELSRIAEGSGLVDTVQDLRDLVALWSDHPDDQAAGRVTAKHLARASQLVSLLDAAVAKESADADAAGALELRNRCFWAGDELASELRAGGRFAFRDEPKVAAKFVSRYRASQYRRSRAKKRAGQKATPPASTPPATPAS